MLHLTVELMKAHYYKMIQNGPVKLPKYNALPNGVIAPYVFIGDDVFALKKFMMKPNPQQNLEADKRILKISSNLISPFHEIWNSSNIFLLFHSNAELMNLFLWQKIILNSSNFALSFKYMR